jgi:hypothetical protein
MKGITDSLRYLGKLVPNRTLVLNCLKALIKQNSVVPYLL